jgi:hypothetical protein
MRTRLAILMAAAGVALGGCGYNGLGLGVGYGSPYGAYNPYYGGYGYGGSGIRIGYGLGYGGYGYNPYYDPFFSYGSRYGYGCGYSPFGYSRYASPYGGGWYNGWYYPGSGYYVYDRERKRRKMTDAEQAQWRQRVASALADRIREKRGETVTTSSAPVLRQQALPTGTGSSATRDRVRTRTVAVDRPTTRSERIQQRETRRAERHGLRATSSSERRRSRDD